MTIEIRKDFQSIAEYLHRLSGLADAFHKFNYNDWPHLCNREDFDKIYLMDFEDRQPLEEIYSIGRDLAYHMSHKLKAFNYPVEYPTLVLYVKSFSTGWLTELNILEEVSKKAKDKCNELEVYPWATKHMIELFDKQIEFLQAAKLTLEIIKTSNLYKIETGEITLQHDNEKGNVTTITNINGKVN